MRNKRLPDENIRLLSKLCHSKLIDCVMPPSVFEIPEAETLLRTKQIITEADNKTTAGRPGFKTR